MDHFESKNFSLSSVDEVYDIEAYKAMTRAAMMPKRSGALKFS